MSKLSDVIATHPGSLLREELDEIGLSARALAKAIKVPPNRVTTILNGERGVSADTARRLGKYFDTSPEVWMNLQQSFDLRLAEIEDCSHSIDEIIPQQTERLRNAISGVVSQQEKLTVSVQKVLKNLQINLPLCNLLQSFERQAQIGIWSQRMMAAFQAPLVELRNSGLFESGIGKQLENTYQQLANFEKQFTRPNNAELLKLSEELAKSAGQINKQVMRLTERIRVPWLNLNDQIGSLQRISDLCGIGKLVNTADPFTERVAKKLREPLGDWRDQTQWTNQVLTDIEARVDFYVNLGFNEELSKVPAETFTLMLDVLQVKSEEPTLAEPYCPVLPSNTGPTEERALGRTNIAHDRLQRLESQLRQFIDDTLTKKYGSDWPRDRLSRSTFSRWHKCKRQSEGESNQSKVLIAYADFNDYEPIICNDEHWDDIFREIFHRKSDIGESLHRLYPIRNDTMHSRPITSDDELLLYVESKRILGAIKSHT